ncbi:phage tail protein [Lysinibacillus sp. FSL K6-0075]|uniref:phage tail protein n=1 Tax=Lysinibacillus sp. FSL K6-0075 TaxID=2921415 RepID=UPI003158884B
MIELKMHHVEKLEELFAKTPKEARTLMARAINRSADTARAAASQEIRAKYIIRASDVKNAIKINKATVSKLAAQVRTSGPVIPLMKFDVTPTQRKDVVVRARVKKGGSKKIIKRGFVAEMGNSHTNVFTRVGNSRLPIKGAYGPSIAQMMGDDAIIRNIATRAQDTLDKRMEHEMQRLLYGG